MRLIDADALPKYTGYALSADEIAKAVEDAPTIEAEPIKHGYWIDGAICSVCGELATGIEERYCENCGARMDEVTE